MINAILLLNSRGVPSTSATTDLDSTYCGEFWELMCSHKFRRTSYRTGKIGKDVYLVHTPPEETGIIKKVVADLIEFSRPRKFFNFFR